MEGGDDIAPEENAVAVVDVTEVKVADGADVVESDALLGSLVIVVAVAPNDNPALLES